MARYGQDLEALRTLLLVALGQDEIGERIKHARTRAGLTQPALAAAIGLRHPQSISNYERGITAVPSERLRQIAQETKEPLSYFFEESNGDVEPGPLDTLRREVAEQGLTLEQVAATVVRIQLTLERYEPAMRALLDAQQDRLSEGRASGRARR